MILRRGSWRSRPIDLTIAPGERVLISGPNGAGKSSLIGLLAGRLEPESASAGAACLLLDEPSNHLDIEALETLEQALESWPGALVAATHDPLMREAIRFDRSFEF